MTAATAEAEKGVKRLTMQVAVAVAAVAAVVAVAAVAVAAGDEEDGVQCWRRRGGRSMAAAALGNNGN